MFAIQQNLCDNMEINIICDDIFIILFFMSICTTGNSNEITTATNSSYNNVPYTTQNNALSRNRTNKQVNK